MTVIVFNGDQFGIAPYFQYFDDIIGLQTQGYVPGTGLRDAVMADIQLDQAPVVFKSPAQGLRPHVAKSVHGNVQTLQTIILLETVAAEELF